MANLINTLGGQHGFGNNVLSANDDGSTNAIGITGVFAGGLNLYGHTYNQIYINNNGNITFQSPLSGFTPESIGTGYTAPIIAPYWADVDTRGGSTATTGGNSAGTNLVWYNLDAASHIVTVTWDDVGYYSSHTNKVDAFQLQLIGTGNGNFQVQFRYQNISWTTGDASGGSNGLGGTPAREGFSAGDGSHYFELPGSGNQQSDLALATAQGNTGQAGLWVFDVTNGDVLEPGEVKGNIDKAVVAPGTAIALTNLFSWSPNVGDTIVSFNVRDRNIGGGYLTKDGQRQAEDTVFSIPAGDISKWKFVAGDAGTIGMVGFQVIGRNSGASNSVVAPVVAQQGNLLIKGLDESSASLVGMAPLLQQGGYSFVVRYYSEVGSSKVLLSSNEANYLKANNIEIVPVFEARDGSSAHFVPGAGRADAIRALQLADASGQSDRSAIYFAVDLPTSVDLSPIVEYFQEVKNVFDNAASNPHNFTIGVYGEGAVCKSITEGRLATYSWVTGNATGTPGTNTYTAWNIDQVVTTNDNTKSTIDTAHGF